MVPTRTTLDELTKVPSETCVCSTLTRVIDSSLAAARPALRGAKGAGLQIGPLAGVAVRAVSRDTATRISHRDRRARGGVQQRIVVSVRLLETRANPCGMTFPVGLSIEEAFVTAVVGAVGGGTALSF